MISFSMYIPHFITLPLMKPRRVTNHDIKVMFGNFRNSGTRRKMATGRL